MIYRIVTGFYPSKETADKVQTKVKGKVKTARVLKTYDFYLVELNTALTFDEARRLIAEYISKGIACGIDVSEEY